MNPKVTINEYKKSFFSKRKKQKQEFNNGVNSTFIIMTSLIIWLFGYYVWALNTNATAWYEIRGLERKKNQLISENEIIITQISQLDSLNNLIKKINNMEKNISPEYLAVQYSPKYVFNN